MTGAAGYLGSCVADRILAAGHDAVLVDDFSEPQIERVQGEPIQDVDVRDRGALRDLLDGVDAVLHLAAVTGVPECDDQPELAFDVNVGGTETVAWLCRERELPLIFPCSMAMIGDPVEFPITAAHPRNPLNLYGLTKAMSEKDVHALAEDRFPAHIYMKSNLYGHHEVDGEVVGKRTVINVFVERALDRQSITVHEPGTQARDFIHVEDVGRAYEHSLEHLVVENGATGGGEGSHEAVTFPLASGDCRSIIEIAEVVQGIVEEERGYSVPIERVENPRGEETAGEDFTVDTSVARDLIGFEPMHSVEQTIREMVRT